MTFPQHEGERLATHIVHTLLEIARLEDLFILMKAHTRPEKRTSTKIVNRDTILLGKYNDIRDMGKPTWYLQKEAKETLEANREIIQRALEKERPNVRILRMPMPDIIHEKDEEKAAEKEALVDSLVQGLDEKKDQLDEGSREVLASIQETVEIRRALKDEK